MEPPQLYRPVQTPIENHCGETVQGTLTVHGRTYDLHYNLKCHHTIFGPTAAIYIAFNTFSFFTVPLVFFVDRGAFVEDSRQRF